jgi:spore maturation protein CgeB
MILFFKSIYQLIQIKFNLLYSIFFSKSISNSEIATTKLANRQFNWNLNNKAKVFAIFSINNWEEVLKEELRIFGDVYHFTWQNVSDFFVSNEEWLKYMKPINQRLMNEFDSFYNPEDRIIIFLYASDFSIFKQTLEYIKRPNVLLISFCWDDLLYFKGKVKGQPIGVRSMCKVVDFNLTMSPEAIPQYNLHNSACFFWKSVELNINNIELHKIEIVKFYVLFIGSKYGNRPAFIEKLRKNGVNVVCHGKGWENPPLEYDQMINEIRKAPLTLGFSNVGYTRRITTIKGRDFEVPFFGGLYLTQYSRGIKQYFEDDEVLTYRNIDDCLSIIRYLQDNQDVAKQIRKNGFFKAQKKASWSSRFSYLDILVNDITKPFVIQNDI